MPEATRSILLGLLLVTAAMAGCMGGDGDDGSTAEPQGLDETAANETETNGTDDPEEPPLVASRTWHNGSLEGGSMPTGGYYCSPTSACDNALEFEVADGAETIVVEAAWEQDASAWFNVSGPNCQSYPLFGDYCTPADDASGDSPLSISIDDGRTNATGTWLAEIWVDESTPTAIEPTIVATVVQQGELPEGYSALPTNGTASS